MTLEDQWPDLTAMESALSGTEEPDQCQEAGAAQYGLLVDAQPANVQATVDTDALLDENATGETIFAFYANDAASADQLLEVHQNTDTACIEEDESSVDHEVTQEEVAGEQVDLHTWQIEVSGQLTGRMIVWLAMTSMYATPRLSPQVMVEDLEAYRIQRASHRTCCQRSRCSSPIVQLMEYHLEAAGLKIECDSNTLCTLGQ